MPKWLGKKKAPFNPYDGWRVGNRAADGWIFAGESPDTHKALFVAPEDAGVMNWDEANKAAQVLQKQGMAEARLPSECELSQMFNNKAKIEGLNTTGANPAGWYWSSESCINTNGSYASSAKIQNLSTGEQIFINKGYRLSARLVR